MLRTRAPRVRWPDSGRVWVGDGAREAKGRVAGGAVVVERIALLPGEDVVATLGGAAAESLGCEKQLVPRVLRPCGVQGSLGGGGGR